jgi:hypothetical protein
MWRKHCIFPPKTLWIATNHFVQSLSFDHQHNFFFPSWNIGFIIPLVSITYVALVHNYYTIKYICFISPRQRAGIHLVCVCVCVCVCKEEEEVNLRHIQGIWPSRTNNLFGKIINTILKILFVFTIIDE